MHYVPSLERSYGFHGCANMDARIEIYHSNARECERAARMATDLAIRLAYLDLARQWREMAEHVEFIERRHAAR